MKKIISFLSIFISIMFSISSFEWPQDDVESESFTSYFGQNRGGILSSSLVFKASDNVYASESGRVLVIMNEISDDSDFFPSSLGTSIIVEHQDKLATVYGNLDQDTISLNEKKDSNLTQGEILGQIGNSGWQDQISGLEFQILDLANDSAINPVILLSRHEKDLPLTLTGVCFLTKNNNFYDLNTVKSYPAGLYKIYRLRNQISNPYKTTVLVNGIQLDQLTFDTLVDENSLICVNGKRKYTSTEVYPNNKLQLLGEVMLSPGKSSLELQVSDFLNNTRKATFNVSIY